jgi:ElaB/YqjD/DUF883 family membrane-anchored ribosome-binding protein
MIGAEPGEHMSEGLEKPKASPLDSARDKLHEVSESVKQQANRAGEVARERYDAAAQTLREGYGRATQDLDKLAKDVGAYVRDNPGRSVLAAAAAGFFLGLLVRRGRRH